MKIKHILIMFLFLFSANSFAIYKGDLCDFDGVITNSKIDKQR